MLDNDGHCKMVDFGFCRACGDDDRMKTTVGTAAYLSPEQLNAKHSDGYSRIVDWWSFGIITYELMTGTTPVGDADYSAKTDGVTPGAT